MRDPKQASEDKIEAVPANRFEFNHEVHEMPHDFDWTTNPSQDVEWFILLPIRQYLTVANSIGNEDDAG